METLGDRIKQLRNKLTQEELAEILQVDRSTVASWEVNRREPDIATLCRIATFFKVSVDWLVGFKPSADLPAKTGGLSHETSCGYRIKDDNGWRKVRETAEQYGLDPDTVQQMLKLNAKIALSLKKN